MTIFYSWQSDPDQDLNRYFIRDCLKDAEKALNKQGSIKESIRVQHDATGAGGTPPIVETIYKRIASRLRQTCRLPHSSADRLLPNSLDELTEGR